MASCCRLCLYENESGDEYFNVLSTNEISGLLPKIEKYLHIEIKDDDIYPKIVCQKCIDCVQEFDIYYNKVSTNQHLLNSIDIDTSIPLYISSPKTSEIFHVTQYSIKTENGIYTLEPTTATSASSTSPTATITLNNIHCNLINHKETTNDSCIVDLTLNNDDSPLQSNQNVVVAVESYNNSQPAAGESNGDILSEKQNKGTRKNKSKLSNSIESKRTIKINQKLSKTKTCKRFVNIENAVETQKDSKRNVEKILNHIDSIDEDDYYDYYSDIDVNLYDKSDSSEIFEESLDKDKDESNRASKKYDNCNEKFIGFPKVMIRNSKLIYRGKTLLNLMSKFYRLECNICIEMDCKSKPNFKCLSNLFAHYADIHSIKGYVICCGTKLFKPNAIAMHMSRHLQPDAFQCIKCKKLMTCPKILQYHIQNHLPENQRPLACPNCPRRFSYNSALLAHSISHLPENERVAHICDECGKSFLSSGRLSTHINVVHCNRGQDFICHICAKQFSCRTNLIYHLTTHQPRIHQVQCPQCNKWLKNKLCLRKHMVQHSEIRFTCDRCDYSSFNRQCLRNHMKVQHSDVKPFSCQHCGKTFKLRNTLINHMVQHTGIKKFKCEFCERQFASSGNYYSHRKRMHKDELAAVNKKKEEEDRILRQKCTKKDFNAAVT